MSYSQYILHRMAMGSLFGTILVRDYTKLQDEQLCPLGRSPLLRLILTVVAPMQAL